MMNLKCPTKNLNKLLIFISILLFSFSVFAINGRTTYQAKIIKPDGHPLEASTVNYRFTVLDPTGSCVLYIEDYSNVNMIGSAGLISLTLGMGTKAFPVSGTLTFAAVFDNTIPSFNCQTPGAYNPAATDHRKIVMQFNDGAGWQTLPAMSINAVPYAMYAAKSQDSQKINGKTDSAFVEYATLAGLSCAVNQAIHFNGASFSCITVGSGSSSGGVTSVTTSGSVLTLSGTASAPVISITAATMSQGGYLTSLDYAEFKAKLSASSTQINSTLGYVPVSSSAVAEQIDSSATTSATANAIVKRDSSGNSSFSGLSANMASLNYVDIYKPSTNFNIRLQAPTSLAANYTLSLPTTSGTAGQVLSTDGSGNLSWVSSASGAITTISVTGPISSTGGSNPTLSIAPANSTTNGYLSATDFTTFMNKQTATSSAIIATLGYTPADSAASGTHLQKVSNLSDLANVMTARANLGLGSLATGNSIDLGSASATGTLAIARMPAFTGDATIAAASDTIILSNSGVNAGTYNKVTVDAKGRVTSSSALSLSDVTAALGYTPANSATTASSQWNTSGTTINYSNGNVGIGIATPTAKLQLTSGTASIAPLKFTSGSLTSVVQAGAIEYDGYNYYLSDATGTRRSLGSFSSLLPATTTNSINNANYEQTWQWNSATSQTALMIDTNSLTTGTALKIANSLNSLTTGSLLSLSTQSGGFNSTQGLLYVANDSLSTTGTVAHLKANGNGNGHGLMVKASGNIGLGTNNPSTRVHAYDPNAHMWMIVETGLAGGYSLINFKNPGVSTFIGVDRNIGGGLAAGSQANSLVLNSNGGAPIHAAVNSAIALTVANGGNVGIGVVNPSAKLELSSGTTSVAPLKLTSGALLTSPQSGTIEYDGFNFYVTNGAGTRSALGSTGGSIITVTDINSTSNITLTPSGSVVVSSTVASTNSQTGALIVKGGLGITGNLFSSGTITTTNNITGQIVTATSGLISSLIAGSSVSGGSLQVESTLHTSKGNILVNPSGGNVGVGTATVTSKLDVGVTAADDGINLKTGITPLAKLFKNSTTNDGHLLLYSSGTVRVSLTASGDTYFNNGNVGIGTSAPGQKLSVSGVIESTSGGFKFPDGSIQTTATSATEGLRGAAVAWVAFNGATGTIQSSFNINSVSRTALGRYVVNFSQNLGDATYAVISGGNNTGNGEGVWASVASPPIGSGKTVSGVSIVTYNNAGSYLDYPETYVAIYQGNGTASLTNLFTENGSNIHRTVGSVGIGTASPTAKLDVAGEIKLGNTSSACNSTNEGQQRYNSISKFMEFCNGTAWTSMNGSSPGQVINKTIRKNCTRTVMVNGASTTMESFSVDKKQASSVLLIEGALAGFGDVSGEMTPEWKLGSGTPAIGQGIMYSASSAIHGRVWPMMVVIEGHTTTGVQTMVFRYYTNNGSTTDRPFVVYNPNSTDDGRLAQTCSVYVVTEIAQ